MTNEADAPAVRKPVDVIAERLGAVATSERCNQTAYAVIGALEQNGWVIVRKRHMRVPK